MPFHYKKFVSSLVCAVLSLSVTFVQAQTPSYTQIVDFSYESIKEVSTNAFVGEIHGKYGVTSFDKKIIVPYTFAEIHISYDKKNNTYWYIVRDDNNKVGVYSSNGIMMLPCKYDGITVTGNMALVSLYENKAGQKMVGFEGVYDLNKKVLIVPIQYNSNIQYDEDANMIIASYQDANNDFQISAFKEDGTLLMDTAAIKAGAIPVQYAGNGLFIARDKNILTYGVLDIKLNPIIPPNYTEIVSLASGNFAVRKNNLWGLYARNGTLKLPIEFNSFEAHGTYGKAGIQNKNVFVKLHGTDKAFYDEKGMFIAYADDLILHSGHISLLMKYGKIGGVSNGAKVLPYEYEYVVSSDLSGNFIILYNIKGKSYKDFTVLNNKGEVIISKDQCGFVSLLYSGLDVLGCYKGSNIEASNYAGGTQLANYSDSIVALYTLQGQIINLPTPMKRTTIYPSFENGYIILSPMDEKTVTVITLDGKIVIPPGTIDSLRPLVEKINGVNPPPGYFIAQKSGKEGIVQLGKLPGKPSRSVSSH
ncbi:WG repeat-containing protein [uncultured Brevibacillus sp.]|uniref:WG repeat-containing protein n=1 Tax=uncultured Brevibacillus sp. TaxID=169970 RepID=UPI002598ACE3|nr:WG repeat-containing protein [uncultured Brevibacillus sp.]